MRRPDHHQVRRPSRRQMLKIVALTGAAGLTWKLGCRERSVQARSVRRSRILMGTVVNLTVVADDRNLAESAVDATLERMAFLETRLSRHRADSELALLNRNGRLASAGEDLRNVVELAQQISRTGDGAFDVSILPVLAAYQKAQAAGRGLPTDDAVAAALDCVDHRSIRMEGTQILFDRPGMAITLDGIGKGYVVDEGVAVFRRLGFENVFVEAGGDLVATGSNGPSRPWRIGIRRPRPLVVGQMPAVEACDIAIATSGDYMQAFTPDFKNHHILDPRTGRSPAHSASCTVTAPTAAMADGLATLGMVLEPDRVVELLEETAHCEGLLVSKLGTIRRTSGFAVV